MRPRLRALVARRKQASQAGTDSLKRRYLIKFIANFTSGCVQLVTQAIFPRALGPASYGDFSYLTNFFTQSITLIDSGVSIGLGTRLAQRPRDRILLGFYRKIVTAVSIGFLLLVAALIASPLEKVLWPDQTARLVFIAAVWGVLTWITQVLFRIMDAWAITLASEGIKIMQKLVNLAMLLLLFFGSALNSFTIFLANNVLLFLLSVALVLLGFQKGYHPFGKWRITRDKTRAYFRDFYAYNAPLFTYGVIGLVTGVFDRWILQLLGGSVQQGFLGLSSQIGTASALFTSAMVPLIHREFSIAHGKSDQNAMAYLFRRYIPLLYAVSGYFSCLICVQARNLALIFGGKSFEAAGPSLAVMALYPIHQAYGQLSGTLFFATGRINAFRNVGIFSMVLGVPLTYWIVAPAKNGGMNGGAVGIAAKQVLMQLIVVNVLLFLNTRLLRLSFSRFLLHQMGSIAVLLALAVVSTFLFDIVAPGISNPFVELLGVGVIYSLLVGITGILFPALFGIHRSDIRTLWEKLMRPRDGGSA